MDAQAPYYPPPESLGGWRTLQTPEEVRTVAGMDPDRLERVRQRQEWLYGSDTWAIVIIRRGYLVREFYSFNANPNYGYTWWGNTQGTKWLGAPRDAFA